MSQHLRAHAKFRWRGWVFRLERTTAREARWTMQDEKIRIRVLYRIAIAKDEHDAELPAEWTAVIVLQGLGDLLGSGTSTTSVDEALAHAERDIMEKVVSAMRLVGQLRRGKDPDPEP